MMSRSFALLINKMFSSFFLIGGGVMGSPGWNAALAVMADLKHQ